MTILVVENDIDIRYLTIDDRYEEVIISNCSNLEDITFKTATKNIELSKLPNLKELFLFDHDNVKLGKGVDNLIKLEVDNVNLLIMNGNYNKLEKISLYRTEINLNTTSEFASLKDLEINNCKSFNIFDRKLIQLESLIIEDSNIKNINFKHGYPNLVNLHISQKYSNIILTGKYPNLSNLYLNAQFFGFDIKNIPNIKTIMIENANIFNDIYISESLYNLNSIIMINCVIDNIYVSNCDYLYNINIKKNDINGSIILKNLVGLREIILDGFDLIDFNDNLLNLEYIECSNSKNILMYNKYYNLKDIFFKNVLCKIFSIHKGMENLISLDFSDCIFINGLGFTTDLLQLKKLSIVNCQLKEITLNKSIPNIIYLRLDRNNISEFKLLNDFTNLLELNLSNNKIKSLILKYSLENLEILDVSNNNMLSFENIVPFRSLKELMLSGNNIIKCTLKFTDNIKLDLLTLDSSTIYPKELNNKIDNKTAIYNSKGFSVNEILYFQPE